MALNLKGKEKALIFLSTLWLLSSAYSYYYIIHEISRAAVYSLNSNSPIIIDNQDEEVHHDQ